MRKREGGGGEREGGGREGGEKRQGQTDIYIQTEIETDR